MPLINLGADLSTIETEFPVVNPGTYPCFITNAKYGMSKAEKPTLVVSFTPEGPVPCKVGDKEISVTGREVLKAYISLAPNALFTLKKLLACAGVSYTSQGFDSDELRGKKVQCVVSHRTKDNKTFASVDDFLAA